MDNNNIQRIKTIMSGGKQRPTMICSRTSQVVVLVRDCSPSMEGVKAKEAGAACEDLVREIAGPANKGAFEIAVIDFAGRTGVSLEAVKASSVEGQLPVMDTDSAWGWGTNISKSLEVTLDLLERRKASPDKSRFELRPVVVMFTDGEWNRGGDPREVAIRVKTAADIVCVGFGDDADMYTLKRIATTPQHAVRCQTGRELRQFLAAVGRTLVASLTVGRNATQSLSQIVHQQGQEG